MKEGRFRFRHQLNRFHSDIPFMLPWAAGPVNLQDRQDIYSLIIEKSTKPSFLISVKPQPSDRKYGSWEGSARVRNPLKYLRIQQPHLAEELDEFFYSTCVFRIGHPTDPAGGLAIATRWLRFLGQWRTSLLRKLHIRTTLYQLRDNPFKLIDVLELLANSPPRRDLGVLDLKLKFTFEDYSAEGSAWLTCPACKQSRMNIEIIGLTSVHIVLETKFVHGREPLNPLQTIESCLAHIGSERPPDQEASSDSNAISKYVFSRQARRINFLDVLSLELRQKIFSELCDEFDSSDGPRPLCSKTVHCPSPYIVCHQFVQEFQAAWWLRHPLGGQLQFDYYALLHNDLQRMGSQMLSRMENSTFILFLWNWDSDWRCKFLWLVNTLCYFSLRSDSSRGVSAVHLIGASPTWRQFPPYRYEGSSGDELYWVHPLRDDHRTRGGMFAFKADFRVALENVTVPVSSSRNLSDTPMI